MRPVLLSFLAVLWVAAFAQTGPASAQQGGALDWQDCGGPFECATLTVPLDYGDPSGPAIQLALTRLPASGDADERIGSLLVNPGGPGASGVDFAQAWAGTVDGDIRERFDIVGWDPRGVGESAPIVCHETLQAYYAADPSPDSQAEWDALEAETSRLADGCAARYPDLLDHVGTKNVARDLDRIRAAVGDEKLTYVGFSYGTVIGQVYAGLFPGNVRALVLDGAVDIALSTDERTITQAVGFERALENFLADCRERDCSLSEGGDPAEAITALLARAEAGPIPAPGADRAAGPGEALLGIIGPLYNQGSWPALERAVREGLEGDGTQLVRNTDSYLQRDGRGEYPNLTEANIAVNCVDLGPSQMPVDYSAYPAASAAFAVRSPHFGPAFANNLACSRWDAEPDPLQPSSAEGAPPIVVIATTGDPATPYEWGVALSRQLASGVLLSFGGEGHTAYTSSGNSCVDDAVNAYLLELVAPADGTVCGDADAVAAAATPTASPTAEPETTPTTPTTPTGAPSPGDTPAGTPSSSPTPGEPVQTPTVLPPLTGTGGGDDSWAWAFVVLLGLAVAGFGAFVVYRYRA